RYIEARYVDDIDREELADQVINNLLEQLDPHSNYISSKQLKEVNEQLEGNFEGIGIEFMLLEDTIRVISPIAGGPSEAVGVLAGDKIVEIEDSLVAGVEIKNRDIISMLRGKKGTKVDVGILRGLEDKVRTFTITRDEIPLHSIDVSIMVDKETGYIKVNRFSANTYKEFMEGLENLISKHEMKNLVIDVRQNPGGYLQEATKILSQLFDEKGKLLVYTEGRTTHRNDYETTGKPFFDIDQIAVLIDEGSASASEILAGAIQDWDRGVIVGRRSFGKGLVQEQYGLKDGAALRLTVARYYTPSGRSIQKDYDDREEYDQDVFDRYENGELLSADSIDITDTTKYRTEKGRIVYGGGGISPDIFTPIDSLVFNEHYIELRQQVPQYVYAYVDERREIFDQSLDQFMRSFRVDSELIEDFVAFATKNGVESNPRELARCKDRLKLMIKSRIARHLYQEEGLYRVLNEEDPAVLKALDAFYGTNPLVLEK
ncbi:MAG: S41 family peptidase, partial [Bacteroidota bacterium]